MTDRCSNAVLQPSEWRIEAGTQSSVQANDGFPQRRDPPSRRMNSRLQLHEVRLRGLSVTGECHATGEAPQQAVEAPFVERSEPRRGFWLSQRRIYPLT